MTCSMSNGLMVFGICLDPGIVAFCFASFALLQLGHPDRARERVEEASSRRAPTLVRTVWPMCSCGVRSSITRVVNPGAFW